VFFFFFLSFFYLLVVDRDTAFDRLVESTGFGIGNSRANSLFWAATRAPPVQGFNSSKGASYRPVKSSCSANSGCDAMGKFFRFLLLLLLSLLFCLVDTFSRNGWRVLSYKQWKFLRLLSEMITTI
jgi:hypothetical protein